MERRNLEEIIIQTISYLTDESINELLLLIDILITGELYESKEKLAPAWELFFYHKLPHLLCGVILLLSHSKNPAAGMIHRRS